MQNEGTGLLITGGRDWADYTVRAAVTTDLCAGFGLAARVQGLRRYYALLLEPGAARLVKLRDDETTLATAPLDWSYTRPYDLSLTVSGSHLVAAVDGVTLCEADDADRPLLDGGVALVCREGCVYTDAVMVGPAAE